MSLLVQEIVNGLALGGIYALLTLGYSMVYGVVRMTNFAHGDFYMVGMLLFTTVLAGSQTPVPVGFVVVPVVSALVALAVSRGIYRPLFGAPRINLLIMAIGASIFLENVAIRIWGPQTRPFPTVLGDGSVNVGLVSISYLQLLTFGITLALTAVVVVFVKSAKAGVAMRAVAEDIPAARLMGINVDRIIYLTFLISGVLAGFGGLIFGMYFSSADPLMGFIPTLKAFAAAVLGGIGSIPGAILGGLVLGMAESLGGRYISSGYQDAIAFGILAVILLVRPEGLMGKRGVEKV